MIGGVTEFVDVKDEDVTQREQVPHDPRTYKPSAAGDENFSHGSPTTILPHKFLRQSRFD
jgi:hypothetical protein